MARFRNPREEAETEELENEMVEQEMIKEPAASPEEEVWKNRYGDLRRLQMEKDNQYKAEINELKRTLETLKNQSMNPPVSEEELEAWRKQYPEFAAVLDTIVTRKLEKRLEKENAKYKELESTQEEIKKGKALMALKKNHPDCEEILADPEFHKWLKTQPEEYSNYMYKSLNVGNATLVLDSYKLRSGAKKPGGDEGAESRGAAKAVRTKANVVPEENGEYWFKESQIQKADESWWEANEEKVYEAQRKGKILMDLSGGAR